MTDAPNDFVVDGISVQRRRGPWIVEDLRLHAPAGSVSAVRAPNELRRTMALLGISGRLPLERGSIRIGGRQLDGRARGAAARSVRHAVGIGWVPRLDSLDPLSRVRDLIRSSLWEAGQPRTLAPGLLDTVAVAIDPAARIRDCTTDQVWRVGIACALARPRAALVVEGAGEGVVDSEQDGQWALLRRLAEERNIPTVAVTAQIPHDVASVDAWATSVTTR